MTAQLRGYLPAKCDGVVLLLHGGGEHGEHTIGWWSPPVLRMIPFAAATRLRGGRRIGVLRLKNQIFGWNGSQRSPLGGTREALDEIRQKRPGVPIVLVGHSMGGRVALTLADEPDVVGIAALAPWIVPSDGIHGRPGQRALLMHGLRDRITDPRLTQRRAGELKERGLIVDWCPVPEDGHAMLSRAMQWHRAVARFAITTLKEASA